MRLVVNNLKKFPKKYPYSNVMTNEIPVTWPNRKIKPDLKICLPRICIKFDLYYEWIRSLSATVKKKNTNTLKCNINP